jgi:hypothetical protein
MQAVGLELRLLGTESDALDARPGKGPRALGVLGAEFQLLSSHIEDHTTPSACRPVNRRRLDAPAVAMSARERSRVGLGAIAGRLGSDR